MPIESKFGLNPSCHRRGHHKPSMQPGIHPTGLPVTGRSAGLVPAVETRSQEEPWTNRPQLSTFSVWEEKQVGESPKPSEGYGAINKRFVVNKLANISARCSFYHSPREQNSSASFLQANKYSSRSLYLHREQGGGCRCSLGPVSGGTMYGPKENRCKCSCFSQGDAPWQGSVRVQGLCSGRWCRPYSKPRRQVSPLAWASGHMALRRKSFYNTRTYRVYQGTPSTTSRCHSMKGCTWDLPHARHMGK